MACVLDRQAVEVLRAAAAAGDRTVDVYLDRERLVVVKVKNGVCTPGDLDPRDVERDEERFAEIPVVTNITEYLWMQDFVEEHVESRGDQRVAAFLDGRAGANARFLKRLAEQAPAVLADWVAFRAARIDEMTRDWLRDLGVCPAGPGPPARGAGT